MSTLQILARGPTLLYPHTGRPSRLGRIGFLILGAAALVATEVRVPAMASPAVAPVAARPQEPLPLPPAPREDVATLLAEAGRLVEEGLFAQAIVMLQSGLADADSGAAVAVLQARIDAVRTRAGTAMQALLLEAQRLRTAGKLREALTLLVGAQHRWPGTAEFAPLAAALRDAEVAMAAAEKAAMPSSARPEAAAPVDEKQRMATLATLRAHLDRVRAAEERGAFAESAKLLREGADLVRDRDADFAARLVQRAAEAELLAAWHDAVGKALQEGRKLAVTVRTGASVALVRVEGAVIVGATPDGELRVGWPDIGAAGVQALVEQTQAKGPAVLGAATLVYKDGQREVAEALLAKALRAEPALKEPVDQVVARGRGEPFDPRGYTLAKEGFVSMRAVEAEKLARKLALRLETVMRAKDPSVRETFLTETLALGPESLDALALAVQKEFRRAVEHIGASNLKKQVDRLAAQRDELDKARRHARDLIYDEVTYFYPYKPPAVSSERFAEYNRVQAEVDRRVDALRVVWRDDRLHIKVPATLVVDLDRVDWLATVLTRLGDLETIGRADVEWARALPAGESIGIQDYCRTTAERLELEEWRRIEAYNAVVEKRATAAVREQLQITNEYRAMFRHRPLALVTKVCEAAQGHAEEMSRLGYFAHMSPTPGRRTPFDRMKLAGYTYGVSENIALTDSALGAHNAWCHSSGHHRNLLDPAHIECGVGADGRYWVQNFGSGSAYQDDPAWSPAHVGGIRPGHR